MEPPRQPMLEVMFGHGVFSVFFDVDPHHTAIVGPGLEQPIFPKIDSPVEVVFKLLGGHDKYRGEKGIGVNVLVKRLDQKLDVFPCGNIG